ncbi:FtsX-like permease family protein [Candidatus Babeliales bacterium]|nr:FtsX-like permease family protein [Candidatus Babeliales bacterium]
MMNFNQSISVFLAQKYLKFKHKDRNISLMIKVCFLGIFIGSFSLMLTLIIMNGFQKAIHEKMQGINSQILIYSPGNKLDYKSIREFLLKNFGQNISGISGNSIKQILINQNKNQSILFIKGIDPENENSVTNIAQKITFPVITRKTEQAYKNLLIDKLTDNQIIIGYKTAQHYNLKTGDQIELLIPEPGSKHKIFLNKKKAIISGIFKVGLEEYDNNFAFCSLNFLKNLFDEKKKKDIQVVDQICINLKEPEEQNFFVNLFNKFKKLFSGQDYETIMLQKFREKLPALTVNSWKDLYPALVSSLKLEKYVMFFILALITLVACMTMVSLLFMYIQQKRRDIAIFQSMGLSNKKIRKIFLNIGLRITFWGVSSGLALAAIIGYFLQKYPFIKLPDVYYISYLPARMDLEIFIIVFVVTMLLGFFATWIPAQRTKKINIAQVLRQE